MTSLASISLAGMRSAQTALSASAAGIANAAAPAAPQPVPESPVGAAAVASEQNLARDLLGMLQARNALLANAAVFRTASATTSTLIDLHG